MKTELKNSYWFVFTAAFVSADSIKKLRIFRPYCNILAYTQNYELKL